VIANEACNWTAASLVGWVTITSGAAGKARSLRGRCGTDY
jgi:hypothetical protein